ncbi:MAG TPA: 3-dehydroquinate synthase [Geobacterales bacterium]|nr:3-dehydroquinate synthase [Geobacterales bacterium]
MERLNVGLNERSYEIIIGQGLLSSVGDSCQGLGLGSTVAVVTNATVGGYYFDTVSSSLTAAGFRVLRIDIGDGERFKNLDTLQQVYGELIKGRLDRRSFILPLGGGVVGDLAGFAAATYLRGVDFVQLPTTLLAQVDSSVGGKTGVNHSLGKNLIGAFYQPRLVLIDVATLATLPQREYLAGLAEVVKYGAVLDGDFFSLLEGSVAQLLARDSATLTRVIRRCCELKAQVVALDERESGPRAVLNYGHTLGHAVETLTSYERYLHGEAVAIGMVQAARISRAFGYATDRDAQRIIALIAALGLPLELPGVSTEDLVAALMRDKKVQDGGLTFVFNRGIGDALLERVTDLQRLIVAGGEGG